MNPPQARTNLLGYGLPSLRRLLEAHVDADYRVRQLHHALYERDLRSFEEITDLPQLLRRRLSEEFALELPPVLRLEESVDGTRKLLFGMEDGREIEAVDIPDEGRQTYCLSSQAGCALACRFCVTGYWGAGRDLDAAEIVGQALALQATSKTPWSRINLVMMGMGEPLLNLGAVRESLEVLALKVGWRSITLSTAGVVPGIEAMREWDERPNLAVSLHAPDDERRSRIMPINRKYPLARLLEVLASFPTTRRSALTFEYTLIRDFNDSRSDARAVGRLISGLRAKVNLIPLNPDPVLGDAMRAPEWHCVKAFQEELLAAGTKCSIRRPKGDDISAACGQLRAVEREARGFIAPADPLLPTENSR